MSVRCRQRRRFSFRWYGIVFTALVTRDKQHGGKSVGNRRLCSYVTVHKVQTRNAVLVIWNGCGVYYEYKLGRLTMDGGTVARHDPWVVHFSLRSP